MIQRILLVLILFLSGTCVYSQTYNVCGDVSAMDRHHKTIDCRDCLILLDDTLQTKTDNYGFFKFTDIPTGKHQLLIQTPTCTRKYDVLLEDCDYYHSYLLDYNHDNFLAQAKLNIKNNTPVIYELGGIAPVIIPGEYGFKSFQSWFGTNVEVVGCEIDTDDETYIECNFLAFDWLQSNWGSAWRTGKWRDMLRHIAGFNEWEKAHPIPLPDRIMLNEEDRSPNNNILLVIDGVPIDHDKSIPFSVDSVETYLQRICPIIQNNDIEDIILSRFPPFACKPGRVLVVTTKPNSGIDTFLLNGEISKRPNRIRFVDFAGKCPDFYYLEKKWKLNKIKSVKIHKKGKVVFDDQNKKYTIFVEVETK